MSSVTDLIPLDVLARFLQKQSPCQLVMISISGAHASGYPHDQSPIELKGIHIEATENLIGLSMPPRAYNWVGEFENYRIDFSSHEIGRALQLLLRGDGDELERILASRHLILTEDLTRLQHLARANLNRRFYAHYRTFSRGVLRDSEAALPKSVAHVLSAYRTALTGIHLLRSGQLELDLLTLAELYGFAQIRELIALNRQSDNAVVRADSPWLNRLVRLHMLMEESLEHSPLPPDPEQANRLEDFLLEMRRRNFDTQARRSDKPAGKPLVATGQITQM